MKNPKILQKLRLGLGGPTFPRGRRLKWNSEILRNFGFIIERELALADCNNWINATWPAVLCDAKRKWRQTDAEFESKPFLCEKTMLIHVECWSWRRLVLEVEIGDGWELNFQRSHFKAELAVLEFLSIKKASSHCTIIAFLWVKRETNF